MINFQRLLKTKDLELYEFYNFELAFSCYGIVVDTHRLGTIDDHPHLKGKLKEDDEIVNDPNLIKVILFFRDEPQEEMISELDSLLDSLLLYLNYDWARDSIIIKNESKNSLGNEDVNNFYYDYVCDYLVKNFGFTKESLNKFNNPTFAFLTQEKEWDKETEEKYKIKFD